MDDAAIDEPLQPLLPQLVPSGIETSLIFSNVFFMRVQRPMRRRIRDILEERLTSMIFLMLANIGDGLVTNRVCVEERRVLLGLVFNVFVTTRQRARMIEATGADDRTKEMVETALHRPCVGRLGQIAGDMPLAAQIGRVLLLLQHFGNGDTVLVEIAGVAFRAIAVGKNSNAGLMRMQPSQQRGSRRAAARRVVELRIAQPIRSQTVEIGGFDLATVTADVRKSHIIVQDDQDIGAVRDFTAIWHGFCPCWIEDEAA